MVPPTSHGIPRVPRYSGSRLESSLFRVRDSHAVSLAFPCRSPSKIDLSDCPQPQEYCYSWFGHAPRSLATTCGISVDFFSSPYLDVSVQAVPFVHLFDSVYDTLRWVSPFGYLRIVAHLQLPEAFRSLSRPSSAPDAKAFPLRSF